MTIRELQQKYKLDKSDFWELKRGGRSIWIVCHDAVEKIGLEEHIVIDEPVWLACGVGESETWAVQVSGYKAEGLNGKSPHIWTTGEASSKNCKGGYPVAITEKRAKDRLILKLINAYEFGIYSDSEAEDFKQNQSAKYDPGGRGNYEGPPQPQEVW